LRRNTTNNGKEGGTVADEPHTLTVRDIAEDLRISERTVMLMAQAQEIPMFKVRNRWRISSSTYREWKEREESRYRPGRRYR
jgi:excisionase family DNA binding protein